MNKSILIEKDATASWQKLSAGNLAACGEIMAPPDNGADVLVRGTGGGAGVRFKPGQSNRMKSIDLREIEFKGTAGDKLVFVGTAPRRTATRKARG